MTVVTREDGLEIGEESPLRGKWAVEITGAEDQALKPALYGFQVTKAATRATGDVLNMAQQVEDFNSGKRSPADDPRAALAAGPLAKPIQKLIAASSVRLHGSAPSGAPTGRNFPVITTRST